MPCHLLIRGVDTQVASGTGVYPMRVMCKKIGEGLGHKLHQCFSIIFCKAPLWKERIFCAPHLLQISQLSIEILYVYLFHGVIRPHQHFIMPPRGVHLTIQEALNYKKYFALNSLLLIAISAKMDKYAYISSIYIYPSMLGVSNL